MSNMRFEDEQVGDKHYENLMKAYFLVQSDVSKAAIQQEILDYLAEVKVRSSITGIG